MSHAHDGEEVQKIKILGEAIARTGDPNWPKTLQNVMPSTQTGGVTWKRV